MTRYECVLNGKPLSDISCQISVLDINEEAPDEEITAYKRAFKDGMTFVRKQRGKISVSVLFEIGERDVQSRKEICQLVQEWARAGGVLKINDRPGQELYVVCEQLPSIASALKWTQPLAVRFSAYDVPYWQSVSGSSVTTSGQKSFFVAGTVEKCKASASIVNTGNSTINSITIDTGASEISFTGIALEPTKKLETGYDAHGYFFAKIGSTSVLDKQHGDDELEALCGHNLVKVSASGPVSMTLNAKGLWL